MTDSASDLARLAESLKESDAPAADEAKYPSLSEVLWESYARTQRDPSPLFTGFKDIPEKPL